MSDQTSTFGGLRAANLALKLGLELCSLGALGYWGASVGSGAGAVALAVAAPLTAAVVWGRFAAPRATRRLAPPARIPVEMGVFALADAGLVAAGAPGPAVAFGAAVVVNATLMTVWHQWDS